MPLCGPKVSTVGVVLSIWGVVQLALTGIFFHARSVALIEDIGTEEDKIFHSSDQLLSSIEVKYEQSALNCWIAALLYVATFCVSAQQFWANNRVKTV